MKSASKKSNYKGGSAADKEDTCISIPLNNRTTGGK